MRVLVLGATGLLGQAICAELAVRGAEAISCARSNADFNIDISAAGQLDAALVSVDPDIVINAAALVSVDGCESDPGLAYRINARPAAFLASWSNHQDKPFIQISTDHFYLSGGDRAHAESDPVALINEYARTKFIAEAFAATAPRALIVRTSIVGFRGWGPPTLVEWAIDSLIAGRPMTLFADAFTSSIDTKGFATALLDLFAADVRGIVNIACRNVYSKEQLIRELARELSVSLFGETVTSVSTLVTQRANCLGLDVSRAEAILGHRLPALADVVRRVVREYRERSKQ